jgi:membrane associated rhomboid family serine protease
MTSGGPDLFVVCKSCQSEVSPYITECPYCGARLRKRAPKLDRQGRVQEPRRRSGRRRPQTAPSLGRLRPGEIPGVRGDSRPWLSWVVVVGALAAMVAWRAGAFDPLDIAVLGKLGNEQWRIATAPWIHVSTGYAFVSLTAIALFGTLLERRHGFLSVLALLLLGGAGGMLLAATVEPSPYAMGANGAALALLVAWAVPDMREWRRHREVEGDLIGAAVFGAVLLVLPAVVEEADWLAGLGGVVAGGVVGAALDRFGPRRA